MNSLHDPETGRFAPGAAAPPALPSTVEAAAALGAPQELVWRYFRLEAPSEEDRTAYDRGRAAYELGLYLDASQVRGVRANVLLALLEQLPWWAARETHSEADEDVRDRLRAALKATE
jgi:hypothetical protein